MFFKGLHVHTNYVYKVVQFSKFFGIYHDPFRVFINEFLAFSEQLLCGLCLKLRSLSFIFFFCVFSVDTLAARGLLKRNMAYAETEQNLPALMR